MRLTRRLLLSSVALIPGAALAQPTLTTPHAPRWVQKRLYGPRAGKYGPQNLPTQGPSLSVDFTTGTLDPQVTFSRASVGTYFDVGGTLRTAASGAPRFDYDPITHNPKGLLIEEARTNLVPTAIPDNAAWASAQATVTLNQTAAPDGSNTASLLIDNATLSAHSTTTNATFAFVSGTTYTFSVFAKAASAHGLQFWFASAAFGAAYCNFDVTAGGGFVGTSSGGTGSMQACANGWYRCVFSLAATASATGVILVVGTTGNNSSLTRAGGYTGTGTGVYLWGAQCEAGAYVTSYIPTTAAAVARAADAASIPGSYAQSGTLVSDFTWTSTTASAVIASIGQGANINNNAISIRSSSSFPSAAQAIVFSASAQTGLTSTANSYALGTTGKVGATYTPTAITLCLNGGAVNSGALTGVPATIDTIYLSYGRLVAITAGWTRRIRYWNRALSNAELQDATATDQFDISFLLGALDPSIAFARASVATYFDVNGTLQTVPNNVARFDYDPIAHTPRGLLIEESRTNLITQSQFVASWTVNAAALTPNAVTSPDGGTTAATLKEDATTTSHYTLFTLTKAASSLTYAVSFFAKQGVGTRNLELQCDMGGGNGVRAYINPSTGALVVDTAAFGTGWSGSPVVVTALPNGWFKYSMVFTTDANTTLRCVLFMATGTNNNYAGDNTSTVQIYGYQVEAGAFPTSYIATTGAAATRAAEAATMTLGPSAAGLSFAVESSSPYPYGTTTNNFGYAEFNDGTTNNRYGIYEHPQVAVLAKNGGTTWNLNVAATPATGAVTKAALTTSSGGTSISVNGAPSQSNAVTLAPGINTIQLGNVSGYREGYIRRLRYWPRVLSDAELVQAAA